MSADERWADLAATIEKAMMAAIEGEPLLVRIARAHDKSITEDQLEVLGVLLSDEWQGSITDAINAAKELS